MAKLATYFDVIHKYEVPRAVYTKPDGAPPPSGTRDGWEQNFRQWCRDNLQDGWSLVNLFDKRWVVNVIDEIDYDLLILHWGK